MIERAPYNGFTASDIISRASAFGTGAVQGNGNAGFTDGYKFQVANILGVANNNLGSLVAASAVINKWSGFKPGYLQFVSGQAAYVGEVSPYYLDEFYGYNHAAPTPSVSWWSGAIPFVDADTTKALNLFCDLGEIDWQYVKESTSNAYARYVAFELYQSDGTTLIDRELIDLTTLTSWGVTFSYNLDVSGYSADFTIKGRVVFLDQAQDFLGYMVGESALHDISFHFRADPTVSMFLSGNSPWTGYDLLKGTLNVSAPSDVVTLPFGVDTDADTQAEAVSGNMYVTDGNNNWWVWNAGTSAWETWNYDDTHVPATSYNILTNNGSLYTFSETLPFNVDYEQSIQAIFGDLPKTLFI